MPEIGTWRGGGVTCSWRAHRFLKYNDMGLFKFSQSQPASEKVRDFFGKTAISVISPD